MRIKKFIISFVAGIAAAFLYESLAGPVGINVFKKDALIISGYKLHHSLYGIFFLLYSFATNKSFFLGFGLGIIFQHTVTDGFRFIQKI